MRVIAPAPGLFTATEYPAVSVARPRNHSNALGCRVPGIALSTQQITLTFGDVDAQDSRSLQFGMAFTLNRIAAFSLLLVCVTGVAAAGSRDKAPCKAFFVAVEQDEATVNLKMVGLDKPQNDWYRKNGNQKEFAGVCLVSANESGERVPLESGSEEYISRTVGDFPLYLISWEEHRVFVPDNQGGHYAFSSNGALSRWDNSKPNGQNFVPVGPVHNTNRTILSSSSVSLLKDAIKQIRHKEGF